MQIRMAYKREQNGGSRNEKIFIIHFNTGYGYIFCWMWK